MSRTLTPAQKSKRTIINTFGSDFYSEIGAMGGQTVVNRYGTKYMSLLATLSNDTISGRRRKRVEAALENILTASNS